MFVKRIYYGKVDKESKITKLQLTFNINKMISSEPGWVHTGMKLCNNLIM